MVDAEGDRKETRDVIADSRAQWAVVFDLVEKLYAEMQVLKDEQEAAGGGDQ